MLQWMDVAWHALCYTQSSTARSATAAGAVRRRCDVERTDRAFPGRGFFHPPGGTCASSINPQKTCSQRLGRVLQRPRCSSSGPSRRCWCSIRGSRRRCERRRAAEAAEREFQQPGAAKSLGRLMQSGPLIGPTSPSRRRGARHARGGCRLAPPAISGTLVGWGAV